jgi:hypothetical protein
MLTGTKWAFIPLPIAGVGMAIGVFLIATLLWLMAIYIVMEFRMARTRKVA